MILDAKLLSDLQSCPRKLLLSTDYEVLRWRAKSLLDACLRIGIQRITNGTDPAAAATDARATFLQSAANPGLDAPAGMDTYKLAKDYCAMLETILRATTKWSLPALSDSPVVHLNSTTGWQPLAASGVDGELHRIITVDRWDEATLSRELHSWYCVGDLCATRRPMTIHAIEIGQTRNGRRASAWARGWKHPAMANLRMRFVREDGSQFKGWKPMYLADYPNSNVDVWVEQMHAEGVAEALVHHIPVALPSYSILSGTLSQMLLEARRASILLSERSSAPWASQPMSRGACDGLVPCPWQHACHDTDVTDPATTGLYRIKSNSILHVA
jgi:hypothetical protein